MGIAADDAIRARWARIKDFYLAGQMRQSRLMQRLACREAEALEADGVTEADIERIERCLP